MPYGIDKRYGYEDGTDLGIAYDMIRQDELALGARAIECETDIRRPETVAAAFDLDERGVDARPGKRLVQDFALLDRHDRVVRAVIDVHRDLHCIRAAAAGTGRAGAARPGAP